MDKQDKAFVKWEISQLKIRRVQYGIFSFVLLLTSIGTILIQETTWESYVLFVLTGMVLGLFANTWFKIKELEKLVK